MARARIGLVVIAGLVGLNGCVGTIFTRVNNRGDWAGEYPFQAVVYDAEAVASDWKGGGHSLGLAIALMASFSWPWDLAIDALLFPLDLFFWLAGWDKSERPAAPPPPPSPPPPK